MFDFFDSMQVGREIEAHGETWIQLHHVKGDIYLVCKPNDSFPCQVYVVKCDENPQKK